MTAAPTPRPRLTPLVRLPQKGSTTTSPAPAPVPAELLQPAFSDEDDKDKGDEHPAVATAEQEHESHSQTQGDDASAAPSDSIMGKPLSLYLWPRITSVPNHTQSGSHWWLSFLTQAELLKQEGNGNRVSTGQHSRQLWAQAVSQFTILLTSASTTTFSSELLFNKRHVLPLAL